MEKKGFLLSVLRFTFFYVLAATGLLLGLNLLYAPTEDDAFLFICAAVFLYLILMGVRLFRARLARKRMAHRLRPVSGDDSSKKQDTAPRGSFFKKPAISRARLTRLLVPGLLTLLLVCGGLGGFAAFRNRIPESLRELKKKYPETAGFVDSYPENKNKKWDIDLSAEVSPGTIPLFLQWDVRWGYETYGSDFLALTGCGPTCISMVVCGLGGNTQWNPYEVARFCEQQGYYVPGEGTAWSLMTEGADLLGLDASYGEISADFIYSSLSAAHPMICSMYPGDFTTSGHFIVLTGTDPEGNVLVNDPNSRSNSEKHWPMDVLLPQIRSLWIYGAR